MNKTELFCFMHFVLEKHINPKRIYRVVVFVNKLFGDGNGRIGRFFIGAGRVGTAAGAVIVVIVGIGTGYLCGRFEFSEVQKVDSRNPKQ